jgi:hypothetical protein
VFAVSPEFVAPNGAIEPIFGTNPIGVGIPTADGPVVLDMATSAYSFFGLLEARTAGKKIPHGVAIDGKGNITEDPNAAIDGGAIKTFDGGYKSSNLALIVELLAGPLVGAAVQDKMSEKNWGNLVLAIDPKLLGQGEFERRAAIVTARVKGAKKAPGVNEILLPGERGDAFAARVAADGVIDVEPNLWRGLQELASEYDTSVSETSSSAHTTYAFGGSENGAEFATKKRGAGGKNGWGVATRLVHPSVTVEDPFDSTNFPLYQTATFGQPSATTNGPYDYTRSGNPTRDMLEKQMAELEERGSRVCVFQRHVGFDVRHALGANGRAHRYGRRHLRRHEPSFGAGCAESGHRGGERRYERPRRGEARDRRRADHHGDARVAHQPAAADHRTSGASRISRTRRARWCAWTTPSWRRCFRRRWTWARTSA